MEAAAAVALNAGRRTLAANENAAAYVRATAVAVFTQRDVQSATEEGPYFPHLQYVLDITEG